MRLFDIEESGKIKGIYAVLQPGKELFNLIEHPVDGQPYKRDGRPGSKWIVDDEVLAEQLAQTQANQQKINDIQDAIPSWAEVDAYITNATTIAQLKVIIRKLARVVYWDIKNQAE